ncbi:hypothetical protein [Bradyrhizobium retamae]|uniref:hypothetical protein n=1 Tax=Bradyrhizobium retamae TaxID=1300035 RepID=UPI000B1BA800|nr:hypothetical protein [Bradyrhizobium retamae]
MDVEIPHTAVKLKRQIIRDGERTGDVAVAAGSIVSGGIVASALWLRGWGRAG